MSRQKGRLDRIEARAHRGQGLKEPIVAILRGTETFDEWCVANKVDLESDGRLRPIVTVTIADDPDLAHTGDAIARRNPTDQRHV